MKKAIIVLVAIVVIFGGVLVGQKVSSAKENKNASKTKPATSQKEPQVKITAYNDKLKERGPEAYATLKKNEKPVKGELSQNEAAKLALNYTKQYFPNADISEGEIVMCYRDSSSDDDKSEWICEYKSKKNKFNYDISFSAKTGEFADGFRWLNTADKSHPDAIREPNKKETAKYLASDEYGKYAKKYIQSLFPGKKFKETKNMSIEPSFDDDENTGPGHDVAYYIVKTIVIFSDGTGYAVSQGLNSHEIFVVTNLSTTYRMELHLAPPW